MEDDKKAKQYEDALKEDIKAYKKLDKINGSDEFNDFFAFQITTVTKKIMDCFAGEGPKNWDEFCKLRGEVIGILLPIQQVRGAKVVSDQLQQQLDTMYNQQV